MYSIPEISQGTTGGKNGFLVRPERESALWHINKMEKQRNQVIKIQKVR